MTGPARPPLPVFAVSDPALASRVLTREEGPYHLTLSYDAEGRLVHVSSENPSARPPYEASLRLEPSIPRGHFTNSFGDSVDWSDGVETHSASFGPWEQNGRTAIDYQAWVARLLLVVCGRNAD